MGNTDFLYGKGVIETVLHLHSSLFTSLWDQKRQIHGKCKRTVVFFI